MKPERTRKWTPEWNLKLKPWRNLKWNPEEWNPKGTLNDTLNEILKEPQMKT